MYFLKIVVLLIWTVTVWKEVPTENMDAILVRGKAG
jgi:hypothetical protein